MTASNTAACAAGTATSWRIADGLRLCHLPLPRDGAPPPLPPGAHRIFVCDVSGSMSGDLPALRQHLKNNLAQVVDPGDTVTVLWFSGRRQFGVVVEGLRVRSAPDLAAAHRAIERFLVPVGLTGFREPLEEVERALDRLSASAPGLAASLCFMSDGHDNQWREPEILAVCERLAARLAAAAVVEYGWYANRKLLVRMAEALGGEYVFAADFAGFAPLLDGSLSAEVAGGARRRAVALPGGGPPLLGAAFAVRGGAGAEGGVASFAAGADGAVRVPEDVDALFVLSERPLPGVADGGDLAAAVSACPEAATGAYAALSALAQRARGDEALEVLRALGDVRLVRAFSGCFGKQRWSAFEAMAAAAARDADRRWEQGRDPSAVPAEDAFCAMDLLALLAEDPEAMLHVRHPDFRYSRTGRKSVPVEADLTEAERAEIAAMTAEARTADDLDRVRQRLEAIAATKPRPARFRPAVEEGGVPMSALTLNETRPNVSLLTREEGFAVVGPNPHGVPEEVPTFRWRNWTVLRDGILNVETLPVSVGRATFERLAAEGLVEGPWVAGAAYVVPLSGLPVVNRRMVARVSAAEAFALEYDLLRAKAAQKVFGHYQELRFPRDRAAGLRARFGDAGAEWLRLRGVADGGFSPAVAKLPAQDVYIATELKLSLRGLSSLPKVADVEARLDSGKPLGASAALMAPFVREWRGFLATAAASDDGASRAWLSARAMEWKTEARRRQRQLAEIKFSVVVGQRWFPEFETPGEGTLTVRVDGGAAEIQGTAELREFEVEI